MEYPLGKLSVFKISTISSPMSFLRYCCPNILIERFTIYPDIFLIPGTMRLTNQHYHWFSQIFSELSIFTVGFFSVSSNTMFPTRNQLWLPRYLAQRVAGGEQDDAARRGDLQVRGGNDFLWSFLQDNLPGRRQVEPPCPQVFR